ncbi:MAG: 2-phosphosulfolactate phosphatase [bacterium]|nr:2-phosphosulfolactate phosphatase [bacterium]
MIRFGWGAAACREAAERGDVVVIVDVLSFSTTTTTAVERGVKIHPFRSVTDASDFCKQTGAEMAVKRPGVPKYGRFSLSPLTFLETESGIAVALFSPNGATCCKESEGAPNVFIGCLRNAGSVANHCNYLVNNSAPDVTVVACGERERDAHGKPVLRHAKEDLVGAGAILSGLDGDLSVEAADALAYFRKHESSLANLLRDCPSGRWLVERGFGADVEFSAELDAVSVVPMLREGVICF